MAIKQLVFDNENELDIWVQNNYKTFFGNDVIFVPGNFYINTKRNKGGKPDGFILDLKNSSWTIIEAELLKHGVWDHIAEQIMRFIVAAKSSVSQRKIRDVFFNTIEQQNLVQQFAKELGEKEVKLIQRIETIIESQIPDIAIFIDEINEDLEDMIEALNATVKVYKIQKYDVNGSIEYLAPEGNKTVMETTLEEVNDTKGDQFEALEFMGGGTFVNNLGHVKFYKLSDESIISIKYSKKYDNEPQFWYGITPSAMEKYRNNKIDFLAFIMGNNGVLKLPFNILEDYISKANTSDNPDGTIKHYHVFIKTNEKVVLYINQEKEIWDVTENYINFE